MSVDTMLDAIEAERVLSACERAGREVGRRWMAEIMAGGEIDAADFLEAFIAAKVERPYGVMVGPLVCCPGCGTPLQLWESRGERYDQDQDEPGTLRWTGTTCDEGNGDYEFVCATLGGPPACRKVYDAPPEYWYEVEWR